MSIGVLVPAMLAAGYGDIFKEPDSCPAVPDTDAVGMARTKLLLTPHAGATGKLVLTAGTCSVAIDQIRLRKGSDTRSLNAAHVVSLAESIAVLGLLEPVVLDTSAHLLAGGHRLAALQLLAEPVPDARRSAFLARTGWKPTKDDDQPTDELTALADRLSLLGEAPLAEHAPAGLIHVRVVDVTGKGGDDLALAVEAAENNVRRQYTREEVEALAKRFKAAGYRDKPGKPKAGEKTVLSALEAAVGRSKRQIQNILHGEDGKTASEWDKATKALERAAKRVLEAGKHRTADQAKNIVAAAEKAVAALAKA